MSAMMGHHQLGCMQDVFTDIDRHTNRQRRDQQWNVKAESQL